jgi:hypothetical protein
MRSLSTLGRLALVLTVLAILAIGSYGYYWHSMAQKLRDGLAPWAEAQRAAGYAVQWDQVDLDGFPTEFRYRFVKPSFGAERPLPVTFEAPSLTVAAAPWNLRHWQLDAPAGAHITGPAGILGFDLDRLEGSVKQGAGDMLVLDITAAALEGVGLAEATHIGSATAHIAVPSHPSASHSDSALDAALSFTDVKLPAAVPGFGNTVTELAFSVQLKGELPPGPLMPALMHWRDAGGTVELAEFRLRWGGLLVDASGTLALDGELQPEGALSAIITGQDAAVDLAVTAGTLQPQDAGIVKAVLGLLAKPGPSGDKAITVPLTLQQSRIYLGPAALGRVPRINWQ